MRNPRTMQTERTVQTVRTVQIIFFMFLTFGSSFGSPALAALDNFPFAWNSKLQKRCSKVFPVALHSNLSEEDLLAKPNFLERMAWRILKIPNPTTCCWPVAVDATPQALEPRGPMDPYVLGEQLPEVEYPSMAPMFQMVRPGQIFGANVRKLNYQETPSSEADRIDDFLNKHPGYEKVSEAGSGTFSKVYYLALSHHKAKNDNPNLNQNLNTGYEDKKLEIADQGDVDRTPDTQHVVKFRNANLKWDYRGRLFFIRDLAILGAAEELARGVTVKGKRFIRVAKDFSTTADLVEGVRLQEAVQGLSAFQIFALLRSYNLYQDQNAKTLLKDSTGFDVSKPNQLHKLSESLTGLEQFYRNTHFDILKYHHQNGLPTIGNMTPHGEWAEMGLDFCYGKNVIWSKKEKLWIIIDG